MKFSDEQLNLIAETLDGLVKNLSAKSGGAPMLIMWGAAEDDGSTVKFLSVTENLCWCEAARITVGAVGYVAEQFGNP